MKKLIFLTLPFFFFLQYAFAQTLTSSNEGNDMCNEEGKEQATTGGEKKSSRESVIYQSTILTVCLAASTVALPMTRNILGTNFSAHTIKSPIAVYASVSSPPYQNDLTTVTIENIKSNQQSLLTMPFEIKVINDGILLVNQADDFQLEHRSFLDYDFFKHRFSRFLS